jgi:hypothetical protein
MTEDPDLTIDGARAAAAVDDLPAWVHRFLSSPGSDNAALADALTDPPRAWAGPVEVSLDDLHRLAGPEGGPVLVEVEEEEWRDDVGDLAEKVEDGFEPAPLVATFKDDHLMLEDGNHRAEALRRAGHERAWTVIAFPDAEVRARFLAALAAEVGPT